MPKSGLLAATSLNNNTTFYLYTSAPLSAGARGKPIAEQVVGWSYYLNDGLNVPRQMSDGTGMVTLTREYTPWGEVLKQAGMGNFADGSLSRGYFGGLMDAATGLLYVGGGQYYDPATGRFLTPVNRSGNPYLPGRWSRRIQTIRWGPCWLRWRWRRCSCGARRRRGSMMC